MTCEFFSELIKGKCPPKPLSIDTTEIEIEKNPFAVKSVSPEKNSTSVFKITSTATPVIEDEPLLLEGPPNVPKEIVKETMAQTDALIRRVMKMTSPDDPAITSVITSDDDLQLANFLSLSLSNHSVVCSSIGGLWQKFLSRRKAKW